MDVLSSVITRCALGCRLLGPVYPRACHQLMGRDFLYYNLSDGDVISEVTPHPKYISRVDMLATNPTTPVSIINQVDTYDPHTEVIIVVNTNMGSGIRVFDLLDVTREEVDRAVLKWTGDGIVEERDGIHKMLCIGCKKLVLQFSRCSRCKVAYYCNIECQRSHWNEHKRICRESA